MNSLEHNVWHLELRLTFVNKAFTEQNFCLHFSWYDFPKQSHVKYNVVVAALYID